MERTGEDRAFDSHLKSFSADRSPHWVELPYLLISNEPLFLFHDFVPILILLLTIFHELENINIVLFHVSARRDQFLELIFCYDLRIRLEVCAFLDIVFKIYLLVLILFR